MLQTAARIYRETRKKHDQLFNTYAMRPVAAVVVAVVAPSRVTPNQLTLLNLALFLVAAALLVALPSWKGGLAAVAMLEVSYCFDCADGMLARFKKLASKEGHLFDFFTDEVKAVLLVAALAIRTWRTGGLGLDATMWPSGDARFLLAGVAGSVIVASAISLTNFVRRPELSGRETTVEAFYETAAAAKPASLFRRLGSLAATFLRWLNHYPSHLWLWALVGRMDAYFWVYVALNGLYLARGWLGLVLRFGRAT
jgi:phosphatidylglycerophosphate synthase